MQHVSNWPGCQPSFPGAELCEIKIMGNFAAITKADTVWYWICSTITVMTSLVALSFYGASQLKFHWVERYDKLLVGSVLCLVGILTLIFHDHDHGHGHGHGVEGITGEQLHRKLIVLWRFWFLLCTLGKVHGMSSSGSSRNGCKLCSILTYMSIVIVLFNLIVLIIW